MSQWPESNRRPTPYHGVALPAELHWLICFFYKELSGATSRIRTPTCQAPRSEPTRGLEPRTYALQKHCSTIELGRRRPRRAGLPSRRSGRLPD